jgi:hypothetical protein
MGWTCTDEGIARVTTHGGHQSTQTPADQGSR